MGEDTLKCDSCGAYFPAGSYHVCSSPTWRTAMCPQASETGTITFSTQDQTGVIARLERIIQLLEEIEKKL